MRELLGLLKLGITKVADGTFGKADGSGTDSDAENDDATLADRFRDMREDWRQRRIQRIENAEERKAERKAARNGVTFGLCCISRRLMESVSSGRAGLLYAGRAGSHVRETGVSWAEPHNTPRNAHKVNYIFRHATCLGPRSVYSSSRLNEENLH